MRARFDGLGYQHDLAIAQIESELRSNADPQIATYQRKWHDERYELIATPPAVAFTDPLKPTEFSDLRWAAAEWRARTLISGPSQTARIGALLDARVAADALALLPLTSAEVHARLRAIDAALPAVTFEPLIAAEGYGAR
ncbi:hypothetical protein BH18ACI5_BH18ACI5_04400 [soil metagenome]